VKPVERRYDTSATSKKVEESWPGLSVLSFITCYSKSSKPEGLYIE
jgi:hypothetical protein